MSSRVLEADSHVSVIEKDFSQVKFFSCKSERGLTLCIRCLVCSSQQTYTPHSHWLSACSESSTILSTSPAWSPFIITRPLGGRFRDTSFLNGPKVAETGEGTHDWLSKTSWNRPYQSSVMSWRTPFTLSLSASIRVHSVYWKPSAAVLSIRSSPKNTQAGTPEEVAEGLLSFSGKKSPPRWPFSTHK